MLEIDLKERIIRNIELEQDNMIDFLVRLIQTPSLSGQERNIAELLGQKMSEIGLDVEFDEIGNCNGMLPGKNSNRYMLLSGHMDHVPPGNMKDPFEGLVIDGNVFGVNGKVVYGRGACDNKGALAAMIFAAKALIDCKVELSKSLIINAAVLEEVHGHNGVQHFVLNNKGIADFAVIGECSNLNIALGHRGAVSIKIKTKGKSVHAASPENGINALEKMNKVISMLCSIQDDLPKDDIFGKSSMSANFISLTPNITNVLPEECEIIVDVRNIPEFASLDVETFLSKMLHELQIKDPEFIYEIEILKKTMRSYTGLEINYDTIMYPFYTEKNHPMVNMAADVIKQVVEKEPEFKVWKFGTDGGYLSTVAGISTIGFGPGEEQFAHTSKDHISVEDLVAASKVYALLALKYCCNGNQP